MKTSRTVMRFPAGVAMLCLCLAQVSPGGGFQASGLSARATGLSGVLVALPGEPTSMYTNPAALSFLTGTNLSLGTTLSLPSYHFVGVTPSLSSTKMNSQVLFPPNLCLTHTFASGIGIGIAATIPYSAKTDWGEDWVGNRIVTSSELRSSQLLPAMAFRIGNAWSVGIGMQVVFLRIDLNRRWGQIPVPGSGLPGIYMTGSADVAYGFEVGAMYQPDDVLTVGLSLKSRTRSTIEDGTVTYSGVPGESSIVVMPNATFTSSITLPDQVRGGVSVRPISALLLAGEVNLVRWSTFKSLMVRIGSPAYEQRFEQAGWKDVLTMRAGLELSLSDVTFRGGISIENSPVSDAEVRPSLPDADRMVYAMGIGYVIGEGLMLDLGIQILDYRKRTVTDSRVEYAQGSYFNGTYDLSGTVVGLNISYSWK